MPPSQETPYNAPRQTWDDGWRSQKASCHLKCHSAPTCLQTIHVLTSPLTTYTDGSATFETGVGSAGVIMTCGNPAEPTVIHRSHHRGAAFTSSHASPESVRQSPRPIRRSTVPPLQREAGGHRILDAEMPSAQRNETKYSWEFFPARQFPQPRPL